MQCPSCDFIFFRSAKKCPSCGGGLARAAYAPQPDEAFTIYAAAEGAGGGLGLDDDLYGGGAGLGDDLYAADAGAGGLEGDDVGPDDFALDLSDAVGGEDNASAVADESAMAAAAVEEVSETADSLDFNLDSGEFTDDVEVDGMGIDLESPVAEVALEAEPEVDLDLGDEPEVELDLGDDAGAEPELDLNLDDDDGELDVALDLGDDAGTDAELDLDLDLGGDDEPTATAPEPEPETGGLDDGLELDGLELDLDLGDDKED